MNCVVWRTFKCVPSWPRIVFLNWIFHIFFLCSLHSGWMQSADFLFKHNGGQYSAFDMAQYVFWTGDEEGVAKAVEEFIQKGMVSFSYFLCFWRGTITAFQRGIMLFIQTAYLCISRWELHLKKSRKRKSSSYSIWKRNLLSFSMLCLARKWLYQIFIQSLYKTIFHNELKIFFESSSCTVETSANAQ